ncbi:MAG: exodeoxyribonuclease VII large subunit [Clostridia bacterium]|nr:exodeoxyribonuclease VII large subunit [Clostridia bacterium]
MEYLSVTVLNSYIKNVFAAEEMLHDIQLCGEVSGIRVSGGNAFFTLKDENAAIQCNCFGIRNNYVPKDGETVVLFGSVDYWHKAGKLSFNALRITPLGEGALALKLEMLKNRLREQGYFDESHKKSIPKYPAKVCVITSKAGAVIRDIVTTCRAKNTATDIAVFDVKVQGEGCAAQLCAAVDTVDKLGYDLIIIARGGGSQQELMPFNDESLVKAIYGASTPIVSAVGHETDYTLCDMVADVRAATPTAAAHLIAFDLKELYVYLEELRGIMTQSIKSRIADGYSEISLALSRMNMIAENRITAAQSMLEHRLSDARVSINNAVNDRALRLHKAIASLNALNPSAMLERGYFYITDKEGVRLKSVKQMDKGKEIVINGSDGKVDATITG